MTTTGAGIGTVEYMAPEQAVGQATKQSDIYSLGIVLYQLLTGSVPYTGTTPFQVLTQHVNVHLPDPRSRNPNLPAELVDVLQHALDKDPQHRFSSAQALGRAVQQVRPDPLADLPTRTSATLPPLASGNRPPSSMTRQAAWHDQNFREHPVEPGLSEDSSVPTLARPGGFTGRLSGRWEAPLPPGWARAEAEVGEDDPPTRSIQGGRTARTAPSWQQRGRSGPSSSLGAGPVPQHPAARRKRSVLIGAFGAAAILLLMLTSVGIANALGLFSSHSGGQLALGPATPSVLPTGTARTPAATAGATTPTGVATPTATGTAHPSPTPRPSPTATRTPTPTAPPTTFQVTRVSVTVSPNSVTAPCPQTPDFHFSATIYVNLFPDNRTITYYWAYSDGNNSSSAPTTFTVPAGSTSIAVPVGASMIPGIPTQNGTYWAELVVTAPNRLISNKATFTVSC